MVGREVTGQRSEVSSCSSDRSNRQHFPPALPTPAWHGLSRSPTCALWARPLGCVSGCPQGIAQDVGLGLSPSRA